MMRPLVINSLLVAALGCSAAIMVVANTETTAPKVASTIWIGSTLDSDRAVNATAESKPTSILPSADPAKIQMAPSATSVSMPSKLDVTHLDFAAPPSSPTDALPNPQPSAAGNHETGKAVLPSASATAKPPNDIEVAQLIVPPSSPTKVPPPVIPPVQMTRPQLDGGNQAPAAPSVTPVGPAQSAAASAAAAGVVVTGTSGRDINVEISRGALIRLPVPADTVFVANPDIADIQVKSPRTIYLFGKKAGETVLYAVDSDDNVLLNSRVKVTHNLAAFRAAIRSAAPTSGVDVATVGDALVISGDVGSAVQAENVRRLAARFAPGEGAVVNQMRVTAPNQINLRVRIAEVSRETLKQFGINWDSVLSVGGFTFGLFTGTPLVGASSNLLFGGFKSGSVDINGLIDALANENLITVLAEPNLTAMSGETANFLAGGEFPVPVAQGGANAGAITIEFKKFGVGLAFTPTVLENGRVNLKVRPEVSQLSTVGGIQTDTGLRVPGLTTRRAETTVELGSGQSFAIAGLLQNNSTQDDNKVPFLGDVPILGALFKSDRYRRNETELVIVVTPYLVKPVSANAIALPTDGFVPPTDGQRILFGSTQQQGMPESARVTRGPDGNALVGPAGFQLD